MSGHGLAALGQIPGRLRNQCVRTRWGQQMAARWGRLLTPERWIFIIGCYNSGTTLLKDVLAAHPQIGVLPGEGVKFTDALPAPEALGWQRMWCRCAAQMRLDPGPQTAARADRVKRQWSWLYPKDVPNLLEKSIANAARMPFLQAHFAPAYFIYILRNGYAVAEGIRRKATPEKWGNHQYGAQYPIELCAEQWQASEQQVEADRPKMEHFLSVKYEDFTHDPAAVTRRITDFLGLDPVSNELFGQQWQVHGTQAPIRNMNPASLARLTTADIEAIATTAGDTLARHGYARPLI